MILKWMPWKFVATRIARAYGFLDPIQFLALLRGFAQPSEVSEPVELLRAGVLFHARGLINTKAIQHNLDWVWPYWVERQFNPNDRSFIPRAFSFSHINLTHRNWTAVGLPDVPYYPIVDPRGLVTPLYDGWSLDFWLIGEEGPRLLPSRLDEAEQTLDTSDNLRVRSRFRDGEWQLATEVSMEMAGQRPHCVVRVTAQAPTGAHLAVVVRPYNPEGISFIKSIRVSDNHCEWVVNDRARIIFPRPPAKRVLSTYKEGDVSHALQNGTDASEVLCPVSMATGAALFPVFELGERGLELRIPIRDELDERQKPEYTSVPDWRHEISAFSRLDVPDPLLQTLYDCAVSTLVLHSPDEVYPGPYTYKRFWYRDAAFILNAIITLGARARALRTLNRFPERQTRSGYFRSQDGEWDSNGEAIWILHRYGALTREMPSDRWLASVEKGARWIIKKRLPKNLPESHAGLLPAGFSAEHLGPNDYYYWDNFWGVAGLRCAAELLRATKPQAAQEFAAVADEYMETITASFRKIPDRRFGGAISASPHRRMDAGAIGSIVVDYPLQLFPPGEARLMKTVGWLLEHSSCGGGFFQSMIHSGINPYLTLHLAQVLLRAGDARAFDLTDVVAKLASPTGQWPEAIHPQTGGGCMGDGQHVWAAAEWVMMLRNFFVREEGDRLVIGSGILPRWLVNRQPLRFGPTLTPFGPVSVHLQPESGMAWRVTVDGKWFAQPPPLHVEVPGYALAGAQTSEHSFLVQPITTP